MYTTQPEQLEQPEEPEFPVFSTVNVSTVDSSDVDQDLDPFPGEGSPVPGFADPNGVVGSGRDAIILAIHAVDPGIGFPDAEEVSGFGGPGNPNFFDSAIGLTVLEPGEYTDVSVPIFPFDGEAALGRIPAGGTYPPNPGGDTGVVAQLWTPTLPEETDGEDPVDIAPAEFTTQPVITPYGFTVQFLTIDGEPVRDGATVTGLNQSTLDPIDPDFALTTTAGTEPGW